MADRTRDPEALEHEIEHTRDELARTIDALADRMNPRSVARRGVARLKEEADQVATAIGGVVRQGPPGARPRSELAAPVLIGAGVVLVVTAVFVLRRRRRRS